MKDKQIWDAVIKNLLDNKSIDQDVKDEYIVSTSLVKINDKEYTLLVKSSLAIVILSQLKELIVEEIKQIIGSYVIVNFMTKEVYEQNKQKQMNTKLKQNVNLNSLTFENFIVGTSNKQAHLAALTVARNLGSSFNPLFIHGDSGLGKTHLLQAITNKVIYETGKNNVLYLTSDDFTKMVVNALNIGGNNIDIIKDNVKKYDVLVIDDIQFLSKREKTNEFLFFIINYFLENGKQLIFSSDKSPEMLNGFDKRMLTRFNSGLSTSINSLDSTTAKLIIYSEIKKQKIKQIVQDDAVIFLAQNFSDDVRKIKGIVSKLVFHAMQIEENEKITLDVVTELFKDTPSANLGLLNVKKIKEIVGGKYDVSVKAIDGKARTTAIKDARHLAMYFAKIILNHTSTQIGTEFGGKDHSTVLSAIARIENLIYKEKEFKKMVEILKNQIMTK